MGRAVHLVVGATGQLGTRLVRGLSERGAAVRAFVRPGSSYRHLERLPGVALAFGDLRDEPSVREACADARVVLATANAIAPRGGSIAAVEGSGYGRLIDVAERAGVEQFVMVSLPASADDAKVPTFRYKRLNERRLEGSAMPHTVLRAGPFMSSWLALLGSSIPLRGVQNPSLERPWWFLRRFRAATGRTIEEKGVALVPGPGHHRNAFVDDADVAEAMLRAVGRADAVNAVWHFNGPEALTWDDVVSIYARVLGRPVRARYTPAGVLRAMQLLLRPVAPGASNIMGLNWWVARNQTPDTTHALAGRLGVRRTTVEQYLTRRLGRRERLSGAGASTTILATGRTR